MNVRVQDLIVSDLSVSVPQDILFQDLGEETIILSVKTGEYYGLNDVGSRMWTILQDNGCVEDLIQTILEEFEVSEERLREEVGEFLVILQSKGLIEIHGRETN